MKNPNESERNSAVRDLLEDALPLMGVNATVDISEDGDTVTADVAGRDLSLLVANQGKALNALQCLANIAANRDNDTRMRVIVDADGYRAKRRASLEQCAADTAERVVTNNAEVVLEPMNAFERRIIHCALADRKDVLTDSRGEEPYRCVVVCPVQNNQD